MTGNIDFHLDYPSNEAESSVRQLFGDHKLYIYHQEPMYWNIGTNKDTHFIETNIQLIYNRRVIS